MASVEVMGPEDRWRISYQDWQRVHEEEEPCAGVAEDLDVLHLVVTSTHKPPHRNILPGVPARTRGDKLLKKLVIVAKRGTHQL